jgi:ABC-type dipeptide/oligopeptide/nickel transport system permease component
LWATLLPYYTDEPTARSNESLAWVGTSSAYGVLFGGIGCNGFCNDSWIFSEASGSPEWAQLVGNSPSSREGAAFANDPLLGGAVLFGGTNISATFSDTWFFNATLNELVHRWTPLHPAVSPSARSFSAYAWDPDLSGVLLFGGQSAAGQPLNDTWLFANGTWDRITTPNAPSPRWGSSLDFDSTTGIAYLFGGTNGSALCSDTWEFSGGNWVELNPANAPEARYDFAMATTDGGYPILFGGYGENGPMNDTWMYQNGTWQNLTSLFVPGAPYPPPNGGVVMVSTPSIYPNTFIMIEGIPSDLSSFTTWELGIPFGGNPGGITVGITQSATQGETPLAVRFDSAVTGGSPPYNYTWTFSSTAIDSYGPAITHVFNSSLPTSMIFTVTLIVTDSRGDRGQAIASVTVLPPPTPPPKPPAPPWALYIFTAVLVGLVATGSYYLAGRTKDVLVSRRELREIRGSLGLVREVPFPLSLQPILASFFVDRDLERFLKSVLKETRREVSGVSRAVLATFKRGSGVFTWLARTILNVTSKVIIAVTVIFILLQLQTVVQGMNWHTFYCRACDQATVTSWANFVWNFLSGQWLSMSFPIAHGETVPFYTLISQSIELGFVALVLSIVIAYPLGMYSGWSRGGAVDNATRTYSAFSLFFPTIVLSFLLIGSSYELWVSSNGSGATPFGILPSTAQWYIANMGNVPTWLTLFGTTTPTGFPIIDAALHGAWPMEEIVVAKTLFQATVIAIVYSSIYLRYLRVAMAEAAEEPYITAGRARGITERSLLWRHAGGRALPLYISVFSTTFSAFLLTIAIVELAFIDIGIGTIVWSGTISLLVPVVFVFVVAVVVTNVTADGLVRMIDRRVAAGRLV